VEVRASRSTTLALRWIVGNRVSVFRVVPARAHASPVTFVCSLAFEVSRRFPKDP